MNYAGDVMTSLVKPLVDVAYTFCFFASGDWKGHLGEPALCLADSGAFVTVVTPIILLGPYWFRFMQCCRRYAAPYMCPRSVLRAPYPVPLCASGTTTLDTAARICPTHSSEGLLWALL